MKAIHLYFNSWCEYWCSYLDTASVALLALGIGILLGEAVSNGYMVIAQMVSTLSVATIVLFALHAISGIRHERRVAYRRWMITAIGAIFAAVIFHIDPIIPTKAAEAMDLLGMALAVIFFAVHSERNHTERHHQGK